jgi:hypothetical protein
VVVNQGAAEGGEQADGGQGVASALGVHRIEGQGGGAQDMQPLQAPGDAHPSLVGVGQDLAC